MKFRASNVMIGTLALAIVGASFGGVIAYQRFSRVKQYVPFHVVFEGSASGLRRGSSVNFSGVRVGEVRSLKLDHPRRVVALALIDPNTPLRADTLVGLEFQGLTGIAAISFTGGTVDGPPPPVAADGIPMLTADRDETLSTQEKIRVALRNVDRVIADNEEGIKDTLLRFESFTTGMASNGERITKIISSAEFRRHRRRQGARQDPRFLQEPRQRQIWRRIVADHRFDARIDREFRQEIRRDVNRYPQDAE